MKYIAFLLLIFSFSCQNSNDTNTYDAFFQNLEDNLRHIEDPIIEKVIEFYRQELPLKWSNKITVNNLAGAKSSFHTLSYKDTADLSNDLKQGKFLNRHKVLDMDEISPKQLARDIELAVQTRNKYQWTRNIPDSIFIRYVLPYKVSSEYPENWRGHFTDLLNYTFDTIDQNYHDKSLPTHSLTNIHFIADQYSVYTYDRKIRKLYYNPAPPSFNKYPSLSEFYCFDEGNCYAGAIRDAYISRSAGIPQAIDEIPGWGSKNGFHAVSSIYLPNKKGFAPTPRDGVGTGSFPAKTIRRTFHRVGLYTDYIRPKLGSRPFPLDFLKDDYWYDSTRDIVPVSDVKIQIPQEFSKEPFAYIYIFNYGNWQPIYFGDIENGMVTFQDMCKNIFYKVGVFKEGKHYFVSKPFLLDTVGQIKYPNPNFDKVSEVTLSKINHGGLAFVEKGHTYHLMVMADNGEWKKMDSKVCQIDGQMTFENVPQNGYFRLESTADERNLARIFILDQELNQVWY